MTNGTKPVADLFAELYKFADAKLEESTLKDLQNSIRANPLNKAVQAVLLDKKEKITLKSWTHDDKETNENEDRLDNMLRAEGIAPPNANTVLINEGITEDNEEYQEQLRKLKDQFKEDVGKCSKDRDTFCEHVKSLLNTHTEFRPTSEMDIARFTNHISKKFQQKLIIMKQSTCEELIQLRRKYHDARRRRRNFSKRSTQILNNYFQSNLNHPYPSEEVKQSLAVQCNISVAQVSNWFGNKRIRYKKTMENIKKETQEAKRIKFEAAPVMPTQYNFAPAQMMNPYQMMMPGQQFPIQPFNFPVYNQEMMNQWQQQIQASPSNGDAQNPLP